jgi:peroxiredoxin
MKKVLLAFLFTFLLLPGLQGGLKPGERAAPFTLLSVDGTTVSLSDYSNQKGVILIFIANTCPFTKAYEERIIQIHNTYASRGFPVVAINSNNPQISPDDSFEHMKAKAMMKSYPFPYLKDDMEELSKTYGATRTPQVFLLEQNGNGFTLAYTGAIDDNSLDPRSVANRYLEKAIQALSNGKRPSPATTRAIGCTIKTAGQ